MLTLAHLKRQAGEDRFSTEIIRGSVKSRSRADRGQLVDRGKEIADEKEIAEKKLKRNRRKISKRPE